MGADDQNPSGFYGRQEPSRCQPLSIQQHAAVEKRQLWMRHHRSLLQINVFCLGGSQTRGKNGAKRGTMEGWVTGNEGSLGGRACVTLLHRQDPHPTPRHVVHAAVAYFYLVRVCNESLMGKSHLGWWQIAGASSNMGFGYFLFMLPVSQVF